MIAKSHAIAILALLIGAVPCWAQERPEGQEGQEEQAQLEQQKPLEQQVQQQRKERRIPTIGTTRQEEKDPEVLGKQQPGQPLIERTNFIADLITNHNVRAKQVPGIDYFIDKLVEELSVGADVPRKDILDNSLAARRAMRDGHADLRRGVALLVEARDIAMEVNEKLQPVVEENRMGLERVLQAGAQLGKAVEDMKEEPPEAGTNPDDSALAPLTDLASQIDPLRSKVQSAASKVEEAGGLFDKAKLKLGEIDRRQRKAVKLDKAASEALARTRRDTASRGGAAGISSEKIIKNEKDRFKETIDEAYRVRDAMKDFLAPESGEGLAVEDISDANKKTQAAKDKVKSTTPKIIESVMMIRNGYKPAYEQTHPKQIVVDQTKAEIEKARNALKDLEDPFKEAKKADAKACQSAQDSDEKLQDLRHRQLGDRPKAGLTPTPADRKVRVSDPKKQQQALQQPLPEEEPRVEDRDPSEDAQPAEEP